MELNVTLIEPNIYLDQAKDGGWIETEIQTQEESDRIINIELETIRVEDGDIVLNPTVEPGRPKGEVAIAQVDAIVRFGEENELIQYEAIGQPTRGGELAITGETRLPTQQTSLTIEGQNLQAADISRLTMLPLDLQEGRVDGNLRVQLQPEREQPLILGQAEFSNVTAQIENIPQKFTNTEGKLLFQEGQNIALENLSTRYGKLPVAIDGTLNTETGYNLSGTVKPVSTKELLNTLKVDFPFSTAGQVGADIQLQGAIAEPILSGTVNTTNTATIDRVEFSNISTRFRLTPSARSRLGMGRLYY